jgi:GT2 family glycosyltransferase/glycosyltransferase involved in cell wall biosynthesis
MMAATTFHDESPSFTLAAKSRQRLSGIEKPMVSVVIPVYNQWAVTARCLASLLRCDTDIAIQIIVVDDGSSDETSKVLPLLTGIDVVRNGENRGFLRSCNRAATIATGKYLFFLNNDTEMADGALRSLVQRIESDSSIGIVGSKLVYPDGRLQEAGGIIFSDASGWNFGRLDAPDRAVYGFVRDVDYVSGAALMIRAALFTELGGFDDRFAPAYYEDADLCFSVRARGLRVVYEPNSVVTHYEGISSGTDPASGTKRFQAVNKPKFRAKWASVLDTKHLPPDATKVPFAARARGASTRTVLVVDSYVPLHDREAGSNRLYHLVKGFVASGFHVIFFPDNGLAIEPYATELQQRGIELSYVEVEDPRDWKTRFAEALQTADIAWVCRPHLCQKYLPLVRQHSRAPVVYDTIDLHHARMRKEALLNGDSNDEPWLRMRDLEITCAMAADATVVVTSAEAGVLEAEAAGPIAVVPTIHDVEVSGSYGYELTDGLLFIGGYNHTPNVDAAVWLVEEIMPLVWTRLPHVPVTLLGSNPPERVRSLAGDRVHVPGFINDVSPFFRRSRLFVAPLRFGAGINGKIGHALTFSLPIVTTPVGASGFGLAHGVTAMVVDNARSFADAIVELYGDADRWQALSDASPHVLEEFRSEHAVGAAVHILDSLLALRRAEVAASISSNEHDHEWT